MLPALILAALIALVGGYSVRAQLRLFRRLADGTALASDERRYLRGRARRRLANGVLLLALAGLLSGAYLSGMEGRIVRVAGEQAEAGERGAVRFYAAYWMATLALVFAVIALSLADVWFTWGYARDQMARLRADHRARLQRDLAVHRSRGPRLRKSPPGEGRGRA